MIVMFSCFLCGSRETSSERRRSVEESYHIGSQPVQGNSQDKKDRYKSPNPDKLLNPSLVLRSINTSNMSSRPGTRGGRSLDVIPESSILANQDSDFSLVEATGVYGAAPRQVAHEYEERAAGMQTGAKKRPSFDEMASRKYIGAKKRPSFDEMVARKSIEFSKYGQPCPCPRRVGEGF